jgi:hypothetical protein
MIEASSGVRLFEIVFRVKQQGLNLSFSIGLLPTASLIGCRVFQAARPAA